MKQNPDVIGRRLMIADEEWTITGYSPNSPGVLYAETVKGERRFLFDDFLVFHLPASGSGVQYLDG